MEKLHLDLGLKEYEINDSGAIFRVNPSDPNLYARFRRAVDNLGKMEREWEEKAKEGGESDHLTEMELVDKAVKSELGKVFPGNDFDAIFAGANVMAVASNGERIVANFIDALRPIVEQGAAIYRRNVAAEARQAAEAAKPEE